MNQISHRVDSLISTPKNWQSSSITFTLRAIMALDHRRLIRPGKKFRPNFSRSTILLYKILPTNLGACKPSFYITYITSEVKQYYEALFLSYRPRTTACSISQYCDTNCYHSIFSTTEARVGLSRKPLKKISKSSIRAAGSDFCSTSSGECLNEH